MENKLVVEPDQVGSCKQHQVHGKPWGASHDAAHSSFSGLQTAPPGPFHHALLLHWLPCNYLEHLFLSLPGQALLTPQRSAWTSTLLGSCS